MGVFKGYKIEWINALTGAPIATTEKISDVLGHLKLEFPGTLTGDATCPILFFKLYRSDATFLAPIIPDDNQVGLPVNFLIDENVTSIEPTDWNLPTKGKFEITTSPNPTDGRVNINIVGSIQESYNWQLSDANGRVMLNGITNSPNFIIDLSVYAKGVYYLKVNSLTHQAQTKIIKL